MALKPRIQILTSQPGTSQQDLNRLEAWIAAHICEEAIEQLFILSEPLNPEYQKALEQRYSKLRFFPYDQQPDFADLMQTAIDYGKPNRLTTICDQNIWLDLQNSDLASLLSTLERYPELCFSLTRHQGNQTDRLLSVNGVLPDLHRSDAWIFGRLPKALSIRGIYLKDDHRERLIHASLQLEGYRIVNACHWMKANEFEASAKEKESSATIPIKANRMNTSSFDVLGNPHPQLIFPPCYGALDPNIPLNLEQLTTPKETLSSRWILVDLQRAIYKDSEQSLLWLLFLAIHHNRYLIAYIDNETDPDIIQLLDRFHQLTGRSLCFTDFHIEELIQNGAPGDVCWISSPAVIGPKILKDAMPLICLSCKETMPIKYSWLDQQNLGQLFEQVQQLDPVDADGTCRLAQPESISSFHIQLITCTYRAEGFLDTFLTQSSEWISTTADYGFSVLHTFFDVAPGLATRRQLLAALSQRKGFFLELKHDPGLYGGWNMLIKRTEEEFISNANPDDCRSPDQLRLLVKGLQNNPVRLVASSVVIPIDRQRDLDWSFNKISKRYRQRWFEDVDNGYGLTHLYRELNGPEGPVEPHNVPHCSPVWRRKIHFLHGLFDEKRYGSQADWGLWCKYAYHGGQFYHSKEPLSGYLINASSYGRVQQSNSGYKLIVSDFLRPELPVALSKATSSPLQQVILESGPKQISIHGLDHYYGDHRISNNSILQSLAGLHNSDAPLKFIWFVEGYFVWGEGEGERKSNDFQAIEQPWFGFLHIPPLTPKWAGNQFAELYFLKEWKESLKHCRALISLSTYMSSDIQLIYPDLKVYSIKHPISPFTEKFELETFLADPKVVLVGYWLRRHLRFYQWRAPLKKIHLLKKYSPDHMSWEMQAFGPLMPEEEGSVIKYNFLPAVEYDRLLRSSLVYLSLYETSGNNSVIECISMGTPFIADRHPAIEEYVGVNYPLLLDPGELERMTRNELIERASEAHHYLMSHPSLAEDLSYERFRENICRIIEAL